MLAKNNPNPMQRVGFNPGRTLFFYLLSIATIYLILLCSIGMRTALLYLGLGKPYNEVLLSIHQLPRLVPDSEKRIFYFGDSTVALLGNDVAPPMVLQEKLADEYGETSVKIIDWAFGRASLFHYYCLTCKAREYSPALVIFNINYRRFGWQGQKDMRDENGAIQGRELIFFAPFKESLSEGIDSPAKIENFSLGDRLKLKAEFWETYYVRGVKIRVRDVFIQLLRRNDSIEVRWARQGAVRRTKGHQVVVMLRQLELTPEILSGLCPAEIPTDHTEMLTLKALADSLKRSGIPFVAYVTPINIEELKKHGLYDDKLYKNNIRRMREIVSSNGGVFLDLLDLLEPEEFRDRLEHYTPEGGRKVVEKLAPVVAALLKNKSGQQEAPSGN